MINQWIDRNLYCFHESFDQWEDAIIAGCQPLVEAGIIDGRYTQSIIECIHEFGPYIVIAPQIAMPHSTENAEGVFDTAISFMKVEKPVIFDDNDREKDAQLFFTLASVDHQAHLDNMMKLSEMLMDDTMVNSLLNVTTIKDLKQLACINANERGF